MALHPTKYFYSNKIRIHFNCLCYYTKLQAHTLNSTSATAVTSEFIRGAMLILLTSGNRKDIGKVAFISSSLNGSIDELTRSHYGEECVLLYIYIYLLYNSNNYLCVHSIRTLTAVTMVTAALMACTLLCILHSQPQLVCIIKITPKNRGFVQKLILPRLVKKLPAFYAT